MDYKTFFTTNNKSGCKSTQKWLSKYEPNLLSKIELFINNHNELKELKFQQKLGFKYVNSTPPDYYYVKQLRRFNQSDSLLQEVINKSISDNKSNYPNMSRHEIMVDNNYYRIYDCGTKEYELILPITKNPK